MDRITKVRLDKKEIASKGKVEVTVDYDATADRTVTVTASGLKLEPAKIEVKGALGSAKATLQVTRKDGQAAGEAYVLTFSMSGTHETVSLKVT